MSGYKRSDMLHVIEEYVLNPRYRELLKLRFCDGRTYEEISEAVNYSPQHVKHVCSTYKDYLLSCL